VSGVVKIWHIIFKIYEDLDRFVEQMIVSFRRACCSKTLVTIGSQLANLKIDGGSVFASVV